MAATLLAHNIQPYADLEAMLATSHKAMVVAATGAGKTSVTVKYLEDHNLQGLVVCPKVSICKQWDTVSENIATMTYQKFCNGPDVSTYDCYIFDEAHHTGASKWGKAVKGLMVSTDKPVIGLTADPKRYLDGGRDMGQELWDGNVVYGVDLDEAIQKGILPGGIFVSALFDAGTELEKYRNIPVTDTLKGRLKTCIENCLSITEILHKHMPEGKRKGIVFVDCIDRIQESVALIQAAYPFEPVSFIHSGRSQKQNAEALMAFNRAGHGFIVTVDMLNEGVHIPDVNTIIMLRRTSSPNVFMQQLGRGFSPSSKDVAIFDFVGNNCSLKIISKHIDVVNGGADTKNDGPKQSSQFIVCDYATPVVELLDDINRFLNGGWAQEEDDILRVHYVSMGSKVANLLPGRTRKACKDRAYQLGLTTETRVPWTEQEDNILRAAYPNMGSKISAHLPGRTPEACKSRASYLGLNMGKWHPWTEQEDSILRANFPNIGEKVITQLPGRTQYACQYRACQLGITTKHSPHWTGDEDNILRTHFDVMGSKIVNLLPGRTWRACQKRAHQLNLSAGKNPPWTEEEDDILRVDYPNIGGKASARLPGRTSKACTKRARQLGLSTGKNIPWTEQEDNVLRTYYANMSSKITTLLPDRTLNACQYRARQLGLTIKPLQWAKAEDDILRANYISMGPKVADLLPGRTCGACRRRAYTLGL